MVSKITGQLVDPFPVKVKPPFVYAAGIDIFVGNKSPSIGVGWMDGWMDGWMNE